MSNIANLLLTLQVALSIGYLSARLAAAGTHYAQKAADTILQTLIFAALASVMMEAVRQANGNRWIGILLAIAASLAAAAVWQRWGREAVVKALRWLKITNEDFQPSTLMSVVDMRYPCAFLAVETTDGYRHESRLTDLSKKLPNFPFVVDPQGSISMYITSTIEPKNREATDFSEDVEKWSKEDFSLITHIPAAEIRRIELMRDHSSSPSLVSKGD